MARSDSWNGVSPRAAALVAGTRPMPYATHMGLCNRVPLHRYHLPDGRTVREVVQTDIWASGPTWFFTLETDEGQPIPEVAWTDQEMADVMGFRVSEAEPAITEYEAALFTMQMESVVQGTTVLYWAEQQKFERWQAARARGEGPGPTAVGRQFRIGADIAADRRPLMAEAVHTYLRRAGDDGATITTSPDGTTTIRGHVTPALEDWIRGDYPELEVDGIPGPAVTR